MAGQHGELDSLAWLGDLVDAYNTSSATPLALELNLDSYGRNLSLSDLFSGQDDDIFSGVNLGGDNQNILAVEGGLVDNGINAFTFTVNGDSGDTVRLSDDWMFIGDDSGGEGLTYSYYTTGYDLLMVQSEIAVVFGA